MNARNTFKRNQVLAVDARPLVRGYGGMRKYLEKMLDEPVLTDQFSVILYVDTALSAEQEKKYKLCGFSIRQFGCNRVCWYFFVPFWLRKDKPHFFWGTRHHLPLIVPNNCKLVVSIHDLVWLQCPESMTKLRWLSERILMPMALKKSDEIVCISETTRDLVHKFYPETSIKTSVVYHGENAVKIELNNHKPPVDGAYFLAVGTLEPRKNYISMISAFEKYCHDYHGKNYLVIVGREGWKCEGILNMIENTTAKERLIIFDNLSDLELEKLLAFATAFVSSSIDEGFGLPALEARAYSVPLLLSDIDIYRELHPDAHAFFDPFDIGLCAKLLKQAERLSKRDGTSKKRRKWSDSAMDMATTIVR